MRDHRSRLDGIRADEIGHGAERARERIAEKPEASPLEESQAPSVNVVACPASTLAEAAEREAKVGRRIRLRGRDNDKGSSVAGV